MEKEIIWKSIPGIPHYEASNDGQVRRLAHICEYSAKGRIIKRPFSEQVIHPVIDRIVHPIK